MIYTIGYQQRKPSELISLLKHNNVKTLVDIRELPLSRVYGYSKTRLSNILETNGINYIHLRELGTPKWMRKKYSVSKNYEEFFIEFKEYIQPKLNNGLTSLLENVFEEDNKPYCLFCYERNYQQCHRKIISEVLFSKFQWQVEHL